MHGKVRTREKCGNCGKAFAIIEEIDIHCPACNTRPKTFFIFLYWQGGKHRIARDQDGHLLDSYRRAHRLLENIRKDIDDRIFSIADYLPSEIDQFRGYRQLASWVETKESQDLAPSHLRELRRYKNSYFEKFFSQLNCRQIRTHHIEDFLKGLPKHLSIKTKKNIMVALKNFCLWLHRREILLRVPQFPTLSPPEPTIKWISKEDQNKVLACLHPHHFPLFSFMTMHPLRPGEARALKVKDFDQRNWMVHICRAFSLKELRSRKGKKPYYLPLSQSFDSAVLKNKLPEAFAFLNRHGKPYSSEGIRKLWKAACKKAGVPYINPYNATRHSIASQAVNRGVDLAIVSKALGHSSLEMTKRYASMNVQIMRTVIDDDGSQVVQNDNIANRKSS